MILDVRACVRACVLCNNYCASFCRRNTSQAALKVKCTFNIFILILVFSSY